jgi:RimJ/RimL family protein N-acetyltransferase
MLTTDRLVLRRFAPSDGSPLAAHRSDPNVARYQDWDSFSLEDAHALIAKPFGNEGEWSQLAVTRASDGALLGDIGIHLETPRAEIGFTFAPAHQGQGYATEAVTAVLDWLRANGVREVRAVIDARNASAIALARRLGMRLEGTAAAEFKGAPCHEHLFLLDL